MPILTNDLTFQLNDTGVLLNDDDITLPFVDIEEVDGLDSAPFRMAQHDHEGVDGDFLDAEFETGRDIVLSGTIYTDGVNMEEYLDSLKDNYSPSKVLIPFYFKSPNTAERVLFVKPQGCRYNWTALRRIGQGAVQFLMHAEDPRIYTSTVNTVVMAPGTVITTGRGYNKRYNFGYGTIVTDPTTYAAFNGGNREAPLIITIAGACVSPLISVNGVLLQFPDLTMDSTDVLVIDPLNHTVVLNGAQSRRGALVDPNWTLLQKGNNILQYRNASGATSTATVTWRDTWR